jgi:hypothetical protein
MYESSLLVSFLDGSRDFPGWFCEGSTEDYIERIRNKEFEDVGRYKPKCWVVDFENKILDTKRIKKDHRENVLRASKQFNNEGSSEDNEDTRQIPGLVL